MHKPCALRLCRAHVFPGYFYKKVSQGPYTRPGEFRYNESISMGERGRYACPETGKAVPVSQRDKIKEEGK